MADTKISALTAITGANLADLDEFVVVDKSDTTMGAGGTDKRITAAELAAGLLGDFIGVPTADGWNGYPSLIDPASTTFDDGSWTQYRINSPGDVDWYWGEGNPGVSGGVSFQLAEVNSATVHRGSLRLEAVDIAATNDVTATFGVQANEGDAYGGFFTIENPGKSETFNLQLFPGFSQMLIGGSAGQTDPIAVFQNELAVAKFQIMQTGSFGAFGVTPPSQSVAGTTAADAIACLKAFGLMHA